MQDPIRLCLFGIRMSCTTAEGIETKDRAGSGAGYCSRTDSAGGRDPTLQFRSPGELWCCLPSTPQHWLPSRAVYVLCIFEILHAEGVESDLLSNRRRRNT